MLWRRQGSLLSPLYTTSHWKSSARLREVKYFLKTDGVKSKGLGTICPIEVSKNNITMKNWKVWERDFISN